MSEVSHVEFTRWILKLPEELGTAESPEQHQNREVK